MHDLEYEISETILNVLVVNYLYVWGPHTYKRDPTGHGFIDSLRHLNLVL